MKNRIRLSRTLILLSATALCILAACGSQTTNTASPEPVDTTSAAPTETFPPVPTEEAAEGETIKVEADRDGVFTVAADGTRQPLAAPEETFLEVGQGLGVDATGRAILRFARLLEMEVLRDGELKVRELTVDERSGVVSVLSSGGAFLNDFNPTEEINRRLIIQTDFAVITATGTRFLIDREANSPLEWIVGLDAKEGSLEVMADGVTKPVPTGTARWIAPVGEPSPGIPATVADLESWIGKLQDGIPAPDLGDVVFPPADVVANTAALAELPPPGESFDLVSTAQGTVRLTLNPSGYRYDLQDCNGDSVRDIIIQGGKLEIDFRPLLARVRAVDVTVLNQGRPGGGSLRVLDPGRGEVGSQPLSVGPGQVQILSMRSNQPYHYGELEIDDGCFLGLSLTPPTSTGEPGLPRPGVAGIERPPENGWLQAPPMNTAGYEAAIEIDGASDDWDRLAQLSGVGWTAFDAVVHDPACVNRYPPPAPGGPIDLGGQVHLAYDDVHLYVAFLVDDDGYVGYSGADQRYFVGDAPQLSLDTDLSGDFFETALNQDDLQVDLHPGLEGTSTPYFARAALWQLGTLRSRELSEARVAAAPTDTGYFLEAALPWAALEFTPHPGARLGIAASVSDNDTPGTDAQECMISTAPQRDWQNPTTWGTLLLDQ